MAASAVLVIVVAAGEASSAATSAMLAAAESALATGTSVRLVEVSYPSDGAALRVEDELGARASAALVWEDAAHLRARIRLHVAQTDRWTDRLLTFSAADSARERGRTLGLAVVTMWPDGAAMPRAAAAAARPPPAVPPPAVVAAPTRSPVAAAPVAAPTPAGPDGDGGERGRLVASAPAAASASASEPVDAPSSSGRAARAPPEQAEPAIERARRPTAPPREPPGSPLSRHALEVGAVASSGVMGTATGYGGMLDGAVFVIPQLSIRAGLALRTGPVADLPGSDLVASIGAGLEWWPRPTTARRHIGVGVRSGALLIRHQVFATSSAGGTESYGRFVPAAELIPQLAWAPSGGLEVLLGAGAEVAFGTTDIRRGSAREVVARIPPVRVVGQAGVRFRF